MPAANTVSEATEAVGVAGDRGGGRSQVSVKAVASAVTQVVAEPVAVGEATAEFVAAANTMTEVAEAVAVSVVEAVTMSVVEVATVAMEDATAEAVTVRDFVKETVAPSLCDSVVIGSISACVGGGRVDATVLYTCASL